jgi:hypothetical protein
VGAKLGWKAWHSRREAFWTWYQSADVSARRNFVGGVRIIDLQT